MKQFFWLIILLLVSLTACSEDLSTATATAIQATMTPAQTSTAKSNTPVPTETNTPLSPTATPTLAVTEIPTLSNLSAEIDDLLNANADAGTFSGSVLIAQDGEVLISQGYGLADRDANIPITSQTKFRIASITKQFTAAAILFLQEQGKLDVQDAICDYLSDCPSTWERITIHHLLTHTSGIPNYTDFPDFMSTKATPAPPMELLNRFIDMPLDFTSGEDLYYSNSGYFVLGLIIEQAAGQSYEAFLQETIFTPLELTNSGYGHHSDKLAVGYTRHMKADFWDTSLANSTGGLYATVEDLYIWNQAIHNGQLLSRDSLSQMFADQAPIPGGDGAAYGYGWVIDEYEGHRIFTHDGWINGYISTLAYYPDEKLTIILLSNLDSAHPFEIIYNALFNLVINEE